jgi:hypothetical protein
LTHPIAKKEKHMNTLAKALATASLAAALGLPSAQAGILAAATNLGASYVEPGAEQPIPLKNDGATTAIFKTTTDNTLVVVRYNAECDVVSDTIDHYMQVRIAIDDVSTPFTHFCSANGNRYEYFAASRQVVVKVPKAGTHTVRVFAILYPGTKRGWLDDSSIVIED